MPRHLIVVVLMFLCAQAIAQTPTTAPATQPISGKLGTPVDLFNGKDLTGWSWFSPTADSKIDATWSVKDGAMSMTGRPNGYLRTDKQYGPNYILIVEQRHLSLGGGGILFGITGPDSLPWPKNMQVQGTSGNVGDLINMGGYKWTYAPARYQKRATDELLTKLAPSSEKTRGEFNEVKVVLDQGNLSVIVNGVLQNVASGLPDLTGRIGVQCEGVPMEFRTVQLIPIEPK